MNHDDQLWMNLVPIYFQSVIVLRNPGLNVAYWNFHERRLAPARTDTGTFLVNEAGPLVFFHFSSFDPRTDGKFSWRGLSRYAYADRPDLQPVFQSYRAALIRHGFLSLQQYIPYFESRRLAELRRQWEAGWAGKKRRVLSGLRKIVPARARQQLKKILRD